MTKEVESHEARSHWKLMKKSEVNNKHKNKYGKLKTILSNWYFKRKIFPDGRLIKHKSIFCANELMQQRAVNYWVNYAPVVNWISVRSLLAIASIHEFPSRSIDFVLAFPQADLDVDIFIEIPLAMVVDINRGEWVLKLKNHFMESSKQVKICMVF